MSVVRYYAQITVFCDGVEQELKSPKAYFGKANYMSGSTKPKDSLDECKLVVEEFLNTTLKKYKRTNKNQDFIISTNDTVEDPDSNEICIYYLKSITKNKSLSEPLIRCAVLAYDLDINKESVSNSLH